MKKNALEIIWIFSIVSILILSSCNTTKQTETESDTAETTIGTETTPMETDSIGMNNDNMGTDSIRAVE